MRRNLVVSGVTILAVAAVAGIAVLVWWNRSVTVSKGRVERRVAQLEQQLVAANARARRQYQAGYSAASDSDLALEKSTHTTYADGYKQGWQDVFAGFPGWTDNAWYIIKVTHSNNGHEISNRVDVTPCQGMYESNDEVYVTGANC